MMVVQSHVGYHTRYRYIQVLSNLILGERRTYQSGRQIVTFGGMMSELFNMIQMKLATYADIFARIGIRYTYIFSDVTQKAI